MKKNISDTRDSMIESEPSISPDDVFLASLGYKQVFKREFSKLELFGVSFSAIGLLPSIASVLVFAIPNGGTSAMIWGWTACLIFITCISLAMSELGSAMPTSGGLYYWTFHFSSPQWRCLLSWLVGYANTIGLIAGIAAIDWGCAVQVMAAASIGSNLTFAPTTQQTFGVYAAILLVHAIICSLATRILARLQNLYILLNILLVVAVIIALPTATPQEFKNTASFALGSFTNLNGWPNGYAFILSFLFPLWTIAAFDLSVHISEEATNAQIAVPFSIIVSTSVAGILGFGVTMALVFNMGTDLVAIMESPIGQPLATIFFNSFGKEATLAVWAFIIIVQFTMGSCAVLASSRQTFAFARDGGLPLSWFIHQINPHTKTPVNGVWIGVFIALCLGLLAFAGSSAINAVFSLGLVAQYIAFSIPIAARLTFRNYFKPGPFYLGKFSRPVGIVAVIWMWFFVIVFMFPTTPRPTAEDMNYTVVVLGGVFLFAIGYYYFPVYGGIHWFQGPINVILRDREIVENGLEQSDQVKGNEK